MDYILLLFFRSEEDKTESQTMQPPLIKPIIAQPKTGHIIAAL